MMLIFLGGLQNVSPEVEEAAAIDGATWSKRFRYVVVPMLRPQIYLVVTLGVIGTWQVFDQVYAANLGGPQKTTLTPALLVYLQAFQNSKAGLAAATAVRAVRHHPPLHVAAAPRDRHLGGDMTRTNRAARSAVAVAGDAAGRSTCASASPRCSTSSRSPSRSAPASRASPTSPRTRRHCCGTAPWARRPSTGCAVSTASRSCSGAGCSTPCSSPCASSSAGSCCRPSPATRWLASGSPAIGSCSR